MVAHLLSYYIEYAGLTQLHPHLLGIGDGLAFLDSLCFYFYVRALVEQNSTLRLRDSIHLLPFVVHHLIYLPFFLTEASRKHEVYEQGITTVPFLLEVDIFAKLLAMLVYLLIVFRKLRQHDVNTEQYYSNKEGVDLHWVRNVAFGVTLFWLFIIGTIVTDAIWALDMTGRGDTPINVVFVAGIVAFGYFGFRQGTVFTVAPEQSYPTEEGADEASASERYQRSGLKEDDAQKYVSRLQTLMENEKPYLVVN